jgi:hypothetical protein
MEEASSASVHILHPTNTQICVTIKVVLIFIETKRMHAHTAGFDLDDVDGE